METLLNDFSPGLFVMQSVILLILILLMRKFAWKPILDALQDREEGIENAININLEGSDFASEVSKLDKNATIAVYCRSGNRSGVATEQMAELGFTDMYDMQGGILDWEAAGGPVIN